MSSPAQLELWLSYYSVRISQRAKRMQLKVKPTGSVEVVLPKGVAQRHVPAFVAEHQQWIHDTLRHYAKHQPIDRTLPSTITLSAVNEYWQVNYKLSSRPRTIEKIEHNHLILSVLGSDKAQQRKALQRWLSHKAKGQLIPWLEEVSQEINLPYTKATVRAQKTRWGSCTSRKHISINRALLFMSAGAVRYLFVHELCHTVHLNHSTRYWALVAKHAPDYKKHETELRKAMAIVPHWAIEV